MLLELLPAILLLTVVLCVRMGLLRDEVVATFNQRRRSHLSLAPTRLKHRRHRTRGRQVDRHRHQPILPFNGRRKGNPRTCDGWSHIRRSWQGQFLPRSLSIGTARTSETLSRYRLPMDWPSRTDSWPQSDCRSAGIGPKRQTVKTAPAQILQSRHSSRNG